MTTYTSQYKFLLALNSAHRAYLDYETNGDIDVALVSLAQLLPSPQQFTDASSLRRRHPVVRQMACEQTFLSLADTPQLGQIGLEERDAERKVNAHDPELGRAEEMTIRCVCQHDLHEVDVQKACRRDGDRQVSHAYEWHATIPDQPAHACQQDNRP